MFRYINIFFQVHPTGKTNWHVIIDGVHFSFVHICTCFN